MKIRRTRRDLLAALAGIACIAAQPVDAGETLVPHEAEYRIKISIASGTMRTIVRETNDGFDVRSVLKPKGLARVFMDGTIEESSVFSAGTSGVRPKVYASSDTLSKRHKVMDFVFDWQNGVVTGTINDEVFEFDLDGDVHDRVSIQYQLMHNLLSGASSTEYAMLDGDEIKDLEITIAEPRTIEVPFGTFEAIAVRHQTAQSNRVTTLWCAEELGYLPVLIEQHRDGKRRVRAELTSYVAGMPGEASMSASE